MFNFGLLASSTPYIVMAFLFAISYVWMLFGNKPNDTTECISNIELNHQLENTKKVRVTTYVVDYNEFKQSHHHNKYIPFFNKEISVNIVPSFVISELYFKICRTEPFSDYQHFYFSRPPPFSC